MIGRVAREEEVLPRSGKCTSSIWKFGARFIIRHAFHGEISEGVVRFRLFPQAILPMNVR